jgi:hypothetical protein
VIKFGKNEVQVTTPEFARRDRGGGVGWGGKRESLVSARMQKNLSRSAQRNVMQYITPLIFGTTNQVVE